MASTETATVTFENETAANNTGDVTGDLASSILEGATLNLTTVHPAGTYDVALNQSEAGTVSVGSSATTSTLEQCREIAETLSTRVMTLKVTTEAVVDID